MCPPIFFLGRKRSDFLPPFRLLSSRSEKLRTGVQGTDTNRTLFTWILSSSSVSETRDVPEDVFLERDWRNVVGSRSGVAQPFRRPPCLPPRLQSETVSVEDWRPVTTTLGPRTTLPVTGIPDLQSVSSSGTGPGSLWSVPEPRPWSCFSVPGLRCQGCALLWGGEVYFRSSVSGVREGLVNRGMRSTVKSFSSSVSHLH